MLVNTLKETTPEGRVVNSLKTLDYSGRCERPWVLPLRHHLLWNTARKLDLYGHVPDGALALDDERRQGEAVVIDAQLEQVKLRCGRCQSCANRRKRRWETAAAGFFRTTDLSLFGTWTFQNSFFADRWNSRQDDHFEKCLENTQGLPGPDAEEITLERSFDERVEEYDASNTDHFLFAKELLSAERIKLMKRLRMALKRDPRFEGIRLVSHLAVFELGDLRKRLHMHFLASFDHPGRERDEVFNLLREWLDQNWYGRGIGFTDIQLATREYGDGGAAYLLAYLVKFTMEGAKKGVVKSRSRLATSSGYLAEGRRRFFETLPSDVIPDVSPCSSGDPPSSQALPPGSTWEDVQEMELSDASKKLTDGDVPLILKRTARTIAEAREAWNDLVLWPGWDDGFHRPEEDEAESPPGEYEFSGWLLSHFWTDKYKLFDPGAFAYEAPQGEDGEEGVVGVPSSPTSSFDLIVEIDGVRYDAETGEVSDE